MYMNYPPERLKMLRKRAGLTQVTVTALIGLSKNTLPNWERGKFKPQSTLLERVLNLYAIRIQRNEKLDSILSGPSGAGEVAKGDGHPKNINPETPPSRTTGDVISINGWRNGKGEKRNGPKHSPRVEREKI